jgi:hypothetical protein
MNPNAQALARRLPFKLALMAFQNPHNNCADFKGQFSDDNALLPTAQRKVNNLPSKYTRCQQDGTSRIGEISNYAQDDGDNEKQSYPEPLDNFCLAGVRRLFCGFGLFIFRYVLFFHTRKYLTRVRVFSLKQASFRGLAARQTPQTQCICADTADSSRPQQTSALWPFYRFRSN